MVPVHPPVLAGSARTDNGAVNSRQMMLQLRIDLVIFTTLHLQGVVTFLPNLVPYRLPPVLMQLFPREQLWLSVTSIVARLDFDLDEGAPRKTPPTGPSFSKCEVTASETE